MLTAAIDSGRPAKAMNSRRRLQVGRTGDDDELAVIQDLAVPYDLERLVLQHLGVEDAAVVGGAHHDLAVGQHLRRLRTRFPPHDVVLDRIELAERAIDALRRFERGVYLVQRHAVGEQRDLQVVAGHAPHAAPAREPLQVEEVLDGGRLGAREVLRMDRRRWRRRRSCPSRSR